MANLTDTRRRYGHLLSCAAWFCGRCGHPLDSKHHFLSADAHLFEWQRCSCGFEKALQGNGHVPGATPDVPRS